jgi:hypothetical protein
MMKKLKNINKIRFAIKNPRISEINILNKKSI